MPLTGSPRSGGFFYPQIVYGSSPVTINFDDPAALVRSPTEIPIRGQNIALGSGKMETLFIRRETQIHLVFDKLEKTKLDAILTYWLNHASLGKQATLTLDRHSVPSAPTATDSGGAGNVNVGAHSWVVTFVTLLDGETAPSAKSNVVTIVTSAKQVNLSVIPTGPAGTKKRKIYRTVAGDTGSHKLVGEIADNTTTTYVDNVADASLGADAPATPQTGSYEIDTYNTFFTKAELLNNPFAPIRPILVKSLYAIELVFRQGS